MTYGSLFSGIGGIDLGFDRAGMRCLWQVENNKNRQRVLAKHWPNVRRHGDVETFPPTQAEDWYADVICGGFPCQNISLSGGMEGIELGEQSGLWREFARIVRVLRPRFVVVENVAALTISVDGKPAPIGRVLGDLAACGFDAEWDCLPSSAFGAFAERDRAFILAYRPALDGRAHDLLEESRERRASLQSGRLHRMAVATRGKQPGARLEREPELARLVHGVSRRTHELDRLEGLGNCVDPRVSEFIGRRLMNAN